MSPAVVALGLIALVILGTLGFALRSIRRIDVDPAHFIVGGRSFGSLFLWVLLAGEVYTSFTFQGAAGWAYGRGAPAFYILCYGTVGYTIGYFFLPSVWRIGKERGLLTAPDFFADRYDNKALGVGIGILQFFMIVPYVTLQLKGLQILLSIAGYGTLHSYVAVCVAFLLIACFVLTAGLRGTAWASLVKDVLILCAVIFAGIAIPMRFFGSPATMFDQLLRAHPHWVTLAPGTAPLGIAWFISTVALTSIGFYMGPHSIAATYSARSENAIRHNAIFLPLYQLVLLLVMFAGFAALLIVPGLQDPDQSFLIVIQRFYPPWIMGFIGSAAALAALIPASALLLSAASVLAKNVLSDGFGLAKSDAGRLLATRVGIIAIAIFALIMWIEYKATLVELLLLYYNGVTQFMPGFVFALLWRRVSALAVTVGIVAGLIVAIWFSIANLNPWGLNPGIPALLLNVALTTVVALIAPRRTALQP